MKSRFSSAKNSWIGIAFLFTALLPLILTSFENKSGSFWVAISPSVLLGAFWAGFGSLPFTRLVRDGSTFGKVLFLAVFLSPEFVKLKLPDTLLLVCGLHSILTGSCFTTINTINLPKPRPLL